MLLLWDHPDVAPAKPYGTVTVYRLGEGNMRSIATGRDVTWGFYDDPETEDVTDRYEIHYLSIDGQQMAMVKNPDIRRMQRLPEHCILNIALRDATGFPRVSHRIDIETLDRVYTIYTNQAGKVQFPAIAGARLRISIQDRPKALDTIVPKAHEADWTTLVAQGSWVDTDQRGWY